MYHKLTVALLARENSKLDFTNCCILIYHEKGELFRLCEPENSSFVPRSFSSVRWRLDKRMG